ncbi:MAG: terminus macrodomain insulation protein YfbV [Succinivibrio sp.]
MLNSLRSGIEYMKNWPDEPLLNPVFAEGRVKRVMNFASIILPPFMILTVIWSIYLGGGFKGVPLYYALLENIEVTIVCLLFLMLMPLQGYYWFYRRSITKLNDRQKQFYVKLCAKLSREASHDPLMLDLEKTINAGIKQFGTDFLKEL